MRKDLREEEVHAAIDALVADGKEASCRAVLDRLGGSMSTVIKYMGTYEASRPPAVALPQPSEDVARQLAEIMSRIAAGARAELEVRLGEAKVRIDELLAQCEGLEAVRASLTKEKGDLATRCEALSEQVDTEVAEKTRLSEDLERTLQAAERNLLELAQTRNKVETQADKLTEQADEVRRLTAVCGTETKARIEAEKAAAVSAARLKDTETMLQMAQREIGSLTTEVEKNRETAAREREKAGAYQQAASDAAIEAAAAKAQLAVMTPGEKPTTGKKAASQPPGGTQGDGQQGLPDETSKASAGTAEPTPKTPTATAGRTRRTRVPGTAPGQRRSKRNG